MNSLRGHLANIIRGEVAKLGILIAVEYRVVSQAGDAVDLQIARKASGLPDLARVFARPGAAGHKATYAAGSLVMVAFVEGDATRPFIAFGGVVGAPGTIPQSAELDATGIIRIGRSASEVVVGGNIPEPHPVARAPELSTWATAVTLALGQIAVLLNAAPGPVLSAPGTVTPVSPLSGAVASTLLSTQ